MGVVQIERYLKMKLFYLLVNLNFGEASPIAQSWNNQRVELEAKSSLTWDMTNNCGVRPQGPMYPFPPESKNSTLRAAHCDIVPDGRYIRGYKCETKCQMSDQPVKISCDCFTRLGYALVVKPCEWKMSRKCPDVPQYIQFDWECDPRVENCAENQYVPVLTTTKSFTAALTTTAQTTTSARSRLPTTNILTTTVATTSITTRTTVMTITTATSPTTISSDMTTIFQNFENENITVPNFTILDEISQKSNLTDSQQNQIVINFNPILNNSVENGNMTQMKPRNLIQNLENEEMEHFIRQKAIELIFEGINTTDTSTAESRKRLRVLHEFFHFANL